MNEFIKIEENDIPKLVGVLTKTLVCGSEGASQVQVVDGKCVKLIVFIAVDVAMDVRKIKALKRDLLLEKMCPEAALFVILKDWWERSGDSANLNKLISVLALNGIIGIDGLLLTSVGKDTLVNRNESLPNHSNKRKFTDSTVPPMAASIIKLEPGLVKSEDRKMFKLFFYSSEDEGYEQEVELYIADGPSITVGNVLQEMSTVFSLEHNNNGALRLLEIASHKVVNIIENDVSAEIICEPSPARYFRAEEVPENERSLGSEETLAHVAHFERDTRSTFGIPFLLKVCYGETFASVKEKIRNRLDLGDSDWDKIRIALVTHGNPVFLEKDNEHFTLMPDHFKSYSQSYMGKPWFGICHVNKVLKRSRISSFDVSDASTIC